MKKEIIINEKIPIAVGPFSPALKVGKLLFISGQIPIDPKSGNLVKGDIEKQITQILINLKTILGEYSLSLENVVKTTVFLKDMNNFSRLNQVYAQYFSKEYPTRSCIEVAGLPKNAEIEIEAIAICD